MKITGGKTYVVKLPTRRIHNWASKMQTPIGHHVLLKLETDEGISGWGECAAIATWGGARGIYYGETSETVVHLVQDYFLPRLIGQDPRVIGPLHRSMDQAVKGHVYAKALVDHALYDIAGKALGVPVSTLLGGAYQEWIPICQSLGIMDDDEAVSEAVAAAAEGIKVIKVKCGVDQERDVRLVRRLREALAPEIGIRVDANEGWPSAKQAIQTIKRMEPYSIMFAEQPCALLAANVEVARAVDTPIMLDESVWTAPDMYELVQNRACELLSIYTTKPGGLYKAIQVSHMAAAAGMTSDVGGSVEMGIGCAANLHLAAAMPSFGTASVCPVSQIAEQRVTKMAGVYYLDDIITESFTYKDGMIKVPAGPGLGITVDEQKLAKYSV